MPKKRKYTGVALIIIVSQLFLSYGLVHADTNLDQTTLSPQVQIQVPVWQDAFAVKTDVKHEAFSKAVLLDGFNNEFIEIIMPILTGKNIDNIRQISEEVQNEQTNESQETRIVEAMMDIFKANKDVASVSIAGEDKARYESKEEARYGIVIYQDMFDLVDQSDLSISTIVGVYDKSRQLIGSLILLNGPITTLVLTDGENISHYGYREGNFIQRMGQKQDLGLVDDTTSSSGAALGGEFAEWDNLFQDYFLINKMEIPGSTGKALKTRYSGVEGRDGLRYGAIGSNMYEILFNNGFFTDIVTIEQAELLALYANAAGGDIFYMTPDGPKVPTRLKRKKDFIVQIYLGNAAIIAEMKKYFNDNKHRYKKNAAIKRNVFEQKKAEEEVLGDPIDVVLKQLGVDAKETEDIYNALMTVAEIAPQVSKLYVTGGKATGMIDSGGAAVMEIDVATDELFSIGLKPYIKEYHSEDAGEMYNDGQGQEYVACADALDGSSKVKTNGGGGTIISFRKVTPGKKIEDHTGEQMDAALIVSYGNKTRMILAIKGKGAHEFVLKDGKFYKNETIILPTTDSANPSDDIRIALGGLHSKWPKGLESLAEKWMISGASIGYAGAFVTDFVGLIKYAMKGEGRRAIFAYPANKLRVRTELQAVALILKEANGSSLTWTHEDLKQAKDMKTLLEKKLEYEPDEKKQQKAPSVFGDIATVSEVKTALSYPQRHEFSLGKAIARSEATSEYALLEEIISAVVPVLVEKKIDYRTFQQALYSIGNPIATLQDEKIIRIYKHIEAGKYLKAKELLDEVMVLWVEDESILLALDQVRKMLPSQDKAAILEKLAGLFISGQVTATSSIAVQYEGKNYHIAPYANNRDVVFRTIVKLLAVTPENLVQADYAVEPQSADTTQNTLMEAAI